MGDSQHLSLGETPSSGTAEPEADDSAERHRGMAEHAKGRMAALSSTGALTVYWQSKAHQSDLPGFADLVIAIQLRPV